MSKSDKEPLRNRIIGALSPAAACNLDIKARTRIPHKAIWQFVGYHGFVRLWERRAAEDAMVSYETELATRLYQVLDRRAAAEELITAWWQKHGIPVDPDKLALSIYEAEAVTENYRMRRRKKLARLKEIRRVRKMSNHTKPVILDRLKEHGHMTASQLAQSTGFSFEAVRQQLSRMAKAGEIVRVSRGVYAIVIPAIEKL